MPRNDQVRPIGGRPPLIAGEESVRLSGPWVATSERERILSLVVAMGGRRDRPGPTLRTIILAGVRSLEAAQQAARDLQR